jgi:hypothetical protein
MAEKEWSHCIGSECCFKALFRKLSLGQNDGCTVHQDIYLWKTSIDLGGEAMHVCHLGKVGWNRDDLGLFVG